MEHQVSKPAQSLAGERGEVLNSLFHTWTYIADHHDSGDWSIVPRRPQHRTCKASGTTSKQEAIWLFPWSGDDDVGMGVSSQSQHGTRGNNILYLSYLHYPFSNFYLFGIQSIQPFMKTTHLLEGDGPTGCMVIPQYVELHSTLEKKIAPLSTSDAIYPMLAKMKEKTNEYLNEALGCETLVMATVLHPFFCLKFFVKWFGECLKVTMEAE